MGPHNACSYADIAMHPIDTIINNNAEFNIALWCRFKDDIFCPWVMGLDKLHEFTSWINTLHPKIKFTMAYSLASADGIEYLDTKVYVKDSQLQATVYTKPSDTHAYLNPNSCHPKHVCMNIPNGVSQRIRRICSEESEYLKHKELHIQHFVDRGYNPVFVRSKFDYYDNSDRLDLIGDPEISFNSFGCTVVGRRFPLVLDFHPSFSGASIAINKHKHLLDLDPNLTKVIRKEKLFVTFRKARTLGDGLVRSRYPRAIESDSHKGNVNCKRCNLCKFFLAEDTISIQSMSTLDTFNINQTITCKDEHVVYVISDMVCNRQNVGSTDSTMKIRFSNHKSHIKKKVKTCRVAIHFNEGQCHKFNLDNYDATLALELRVTLVDKVTPEPWDTPEAITKKLTAKESYWQHQLHTFAADGGLNIRNERLVAHNRAHAQSHGRL